MQCALLSTTVVYCISSPSTCGIRSRVRHVRPKRTIGLTQHAVDDRLLYLRSEVGDCAKIFPPGSEGATQMQEMPNTELLG
jgi:hypothetical protein